MYVNDPVIDEKVSQGTLNSPFLKCEVPSAHFRFKEDGFITQTPYRDPSSKIWRLYLSHAEKVDKHQSEGWTTNVDGVLVFVRHVL